MNDDPIRWRESVLLFTAVLVAFGILLDVKKFDWIDSLMIHDELNQAQSVYTSMPRERQEKITELIFSIEDFQKRVEAFHSNIGARLDRLEHAIRLPLEERQEFIDREKEGSRRRSAEEVER